MSQAEGSRLRLALHLLPVGEAAVIEELALPDAVEHHLIHMGFSPEMRITAVRRAPAGDPTVYSVDGMEVALRRETASGVWVNPEIESVDVQRTARGARERDGQAHA